MKKDLRRVQFGRVSKLYRHHETKWDQALSFNLDRRADRENRLGDAPLSDHHESASELVDAEFTAKVPFIKINPFKFFFVAVPLIETACLPFTKGKYVFKL